MLHKKVLIQLFTGGRKIFVAERSFVGVQLWTLKIKYGRMEAPLGEKMSFHFSYLNFIITSNKAEETTESGPST